MVEPSALAETVMPASLSPDWPAIVPDRIASAACAGTSIVVETSAAIRPASPAPARVIGCLPVEIRFVDRSIRVPPFALGRRRSVGAARGYGLEIGRDGGDLGLAELILETGHARRAVGDDLPHRILVAARRIARQRRREPRRV